MKERRFDELVRQHVGAVTAYARAMTSDHWTADDAVQETLLRAWKYQDSFQASGSFEGWLLRICRNCIIDLANKRHSHDTIDSVIERIAQPAEIAPHEIEELLARVPVAQREVLVLCGILGYDHNSAATLLDVPVGTIKSRLFRGRETLAALMAADAAADTAHGSIPQGKTA